MLLSSILTMLLNSIKHFFFFEVTWLKVVAILVLFPLLSLLFVSPTLTLAQFIDRGHISVLVSETGLDFAKDFLINEVISTTIPLQLPDIKKKVKIPLLGKVQMGLSNIQIYAVNFQSSWVETGEDGIFLGVSGATADLRMNWSYTYSTLFFKVSDHGNASAKVKGMDVQVAVTLLDQNGSLRIASLESNCEVKSINININGGASWLYQGVVDAFQNKIISAVETTVSKKIGEKMKRLDSLLQSLPKTKKIDDYAAVNLTFTSNLVLSDSFVEVKLDGLFIPNDDNLQVQRYHQGTRSQPSSSFRGINRMTTISIDEEVFNSATLVYFNAKRMHMDIEKTKNGSFLNTVEFQLILPKLYRQYPDAKMMINMSVTSPPIVMITENGINATIHLDTTINIQDAGEVFPVACISSVLNVVCSAEIAKNNLAGRLRLISFNATMKWSKLGELEANCVQAATSTILEALFLPYINTSLKRGFPLPIPHGFAIENTEIVFVKSSVMVCSDIVSKPDVNSFKILTSQAVL